MKNIFYILFLFSINSVIFAQTKVGGIVKDEKNEPVPFANVYFKGSRGGVITDDNGKFYLESTKAETVLLVSFVGYTTQEVPLTKAVTTNMQVVLKDGQTLREVVVVSGKTS